MQKQETKQFQLHFNKISVHDIVKNASKPFEKQLQEKEIKIDIDLYQNLPYIYADIEKISWVLISFMSNAVRYSHRWGKIVLEVKLNAKKERINFSVRDSGDGIAEEKLYKIFHTSICSPRNPHPIGVGITLPISKEIIEAHGGEIWADSQPGRGSCFYFSIPILK